MPEQATLRAAEPLVAPDGSNERLSDHKGSIGGSRLAGVMAAVLDENRRLVGIVAALTVVALVARFLFVGDRVAHWDEARVGIWLLDYVRTGHFEYRPGIHGPFYHHVNPVLFDWFGTSDGVMRYPAALVGGLLPLSALLFRDRLRPAEVVALAGFLSFNAVLLYYSRFMRGDVLVGAFAFAAFGFLLLTLDRGRPRYLLAAVGLVALGFTAKENALLYLVSWVGAAALLLDQRLFSAHREGESLSAAFVDFVSPWSEEGERRTAETDGRGGRPGWRAAVPADPVASARRHAGWLLAIPAAVVEFLLVIVFFFAPRTGSPDGVGLNRLGADPGLVDDLVYTSTVGSWNKLASRWFGAGDEHGYLPYLGDLLMTLGEGGIAVCTLALVGFLAERYTGEQRPLVQFCFYWGVASLLGYPIVTDIRAPWVAVHVVLPLAIPAAVGVGWIFRWGRDAFVDDDRVGVGVAALVLVLVAGVVLVPAVQATYVYPQSPDNELVQYAQPADDIHPEMEALSDVASDNEGADVLLYGSHFVEDGSSDASPFTPACSNWANSLPLNWYFKRADANVTCASNSFEFDELSEKPPVVVAWPDREPVDGVDRPVLPAGLEETYSTPEYETTVKKIRTNADDTAFVRPANRTQSG